MKAAALIGALLVAGCGGTDGSLSPGAPGSIVGDTVNDGGAPAPGQASEPSALDETTYFPTVADACKCDSCGPPAVAACKQAGEQCIADCEADAGRHASIPDHCAGALGLPEGPCTLGTSNYGFAASCCAMDPCEASCRAQVLQCASAACAKGLGPNCGQASYCAPDSGFTG